MVGHVTSPAIFVQQNKYNLLMKMCRVTEGNSFDISINANDLKWLFSAYVYVDAKSGTFAWDR